MKNPMTENMKQEKELIRDENFVRVLEAVLKAAGKNHNVVTQAQLERAFGDFHLSSAQMQTVKDYLTSNHVGIDEPLPEEEVLSQEEHNYLKDYEQMVRSIEQPSEGEKEALCLNAMAGDDKAQKHLAECMLGDVLDIARQYLGQGVFVEDLIGAGNEELMRSVRLLGPLEGPQEVESFIGQRVMNAMEDLIAANLDDKAKQTDAADLANRVKKYADGLRDALGRKVTVLELAAEGDVTEEEILDAIRLTGNRIDSIDYQQ